jgi:hypothetical protein
MKISWQEGGHDNCPDGPSKMTYVYVQSSLYIQTGYFVHVQSASIGAVIAYWVW